MASYEAIAPTQIPEQNQENLLHRMGDFMHDQFSSFRESISHLAENRFVRAALATGAIAVGSTEVAQAKSFKPVQSSANNLYTSITPLSSASSTENPAGLDQGKFNVTSIQGFSVNFNQPISSQTQSGESLRTEFVCPPAGSKSATPPIAATEIFPNNRASVTFCDNKKIIKVSTPNVYDPTYGPAVAKFQADPMRNELWAGDNYEYSLFSLCPQSPRQQDPQPKLKFNRRSGKATLSYDGSATTRYCDEVGQNYEELTAQVRSSSKKKWSRAGRQVIRINAMRETLTYGGYGLSDRHARDKVVIPQVGKICATKGKNAQVRVKISEKFVANPTQTFVHTSSGENSGMRNGSGTYYTVPKNACK